MAAYQTVLARHGVPLSDAEYEEHWILLGKGISDLIEARGLALDASTLRAEKAACYEYLVRTSVQPMPGAVELLQILKPIYPLALATSSYREAASCVLESLKIRSYFAVVAANQDVPRIKPAPDLFLHAASALGVQPASCIAFEDSGKGVRAAFEAGMPCIAIPNQHTRNHDFSTAKAVLSSLALVTPSWLASLP